MDLRRRSVAAGGKRTDGVRAGQWVSCGRKPSGLGECEKRTIRAVGGICVNFAAKKAYQVVALDINDYLVNLITHKKVSQETV